MRAGLAELGEGHEGISWLDLGFHVSDSFERLLNQNIEPEKYGRPVNQGQSRHGNGLLVPPIL